MTITIRIGLRAVKRKGLHGKLPVKDRDQMRTYCMKFYLPICHANGGDRTTAHRHTLEVAVYLSRRTGQFERFSNMEKRVEDILRPYSEGCLNDREEFREEASIERVGEVLFSRLSELLQSGGSTLLRLEIGETPLRRYAIGILEESLE